MDIQYFSSLTTSERPYFNQQCENLGGDDYLQTYHRFTVALKLTSLLVLTQNVRISINGGGIGGVMIFYKHTTASRLLLFYATVSCLLLVDRKILLLVQEEYPNPCDSELYFDIFKLMDLGEVVKINHPYFALTTPSPPSDYAIRLNCVRIHPS